MSKKDNRQGQLIEILRVRSYVSIKELAALLGVSEMTIRRDLKVLEENNIARNVDGTSVYNPAHMGWQEDGAYNLLTETGRRSAEKERIGAYAAAMVEPGDIIIVDTGTTTQRIVPHLPINHDLTVLCYNINILMELRRNPGVQMLFAGGHYHPNTQMFSSSEGIEFIRGIRAQKVFISAAGVHKELGVTCSNAYEMPTKKAILRSSLQRILVADSSKFGSVRSTYFCELEDLSDVVTDSGLDEAWRRHIRELGLTLHIV